jgi:hypothetical protein
MKRRSFLSLLACVPFLSFLHKPQQPELVLSDDACGKGRHAVIAYSISHRGNTTSYALCRRKEPDGKWEPVSGKFQGERTYSINSIKAL